MLVTKEVKFRMEPEDEYTHPIEEEKNFNESMYINIFDPSSSEAGKVHGMVVRLLLGGMPTEILDAEAEMPTVPLDACRHAVDSVKGLIGMPIVYGFTKAVKDRMISTEGCNHLTSLMLTMGSVAVQGMAANRGKTPPPPEAREMMLEYVKDTCCVWRGDSEHYKKTLEEIRDQKE